MLSLCINNDQWSLFPFSIVDSRLFLALAVFELVWSFSSDSLKQTLYTFPSPHGVSA